MAETLPQNIPIPTAAAIASFNFFDISEGTGIISFYGVSHRESSSASYYLTSNTNTYSSTVVASGAFVTGSSTGQILSANFDIKFNRSQNLKGYAYMNFSFGGTGTTGTGTPSIFISGGSISNNTTGTTLASLGNLSNQAIDLSSPVLGSYSKGLNVRFDLTGGPYHFAPGDTLRLNLQVWGTCSGTAPITYGGIGIDPQGRADPDDLTIQTTNTTKMILNLPFLNNQ